MKRPRTSKRITRRQPTGADRKETVTRGRRGAYRAAWTCDPAALNGFVPGFSTVSLAPPELVERALTEKYVWIRRFIEERCPRRKLLEYAHACAAAHGWSSDRVPTYTTLRDWVKRYQVYGLVGLIDRVRCDAGKSRTVVGAAADAVELGVATGKGAAETLSLIARVVGGTLPKYHAVYRHVQRVRAENPHLAVMASLGPTHFRDKVELTLQYRALPGGARLSIDSTLADIWVRIPKAADGWEAVRPVLTIVEDVGSRLFVTFNLSLLSIDSGICLATLGRAMNPARNYPGLLSVGAPREIALDKGAEHQGEFLKALKRLQIDVVPRRPDKPRAGAHVERLIGTVTTEVFRNLRGFSQCEREFDPYAPAESDTKRNLRQLKYEPYRSEFLVEHLLTLGELEAHIAAWAIAYNARPHAGLPEDDPEIQDILRARAAVADPSLLSSARRVAGAVSTEDVA